MAVSVFDLFKIGIGPSSSHTVGPMRAARLFTRALESQGLLSAVRQVRAELYGSLGATGKGHGSDKAVLLGLSGHDPDTVNVDRVPDLLDDIRAGGSLALGGANAVAFDEKRDVVFFRTKSLPLHANGMRFVAIGQDGDEVLAATYYSVGGGFVVNENVLADGSKQKSIAPDATVLPFPFTSAAGLLALTTQQ